MNKRPEPVRSPDRLHERVQALQDAQSAMLNLLEDFDAERVKSDNMQRALLNMLEDIEDERGRTEQAKLLLEAVNRELEAFSYSVSHDLRAPLRAISGFAEAVIEDTGPKLDDEGRRYLGLIRDNAHKMGQLIDDLLAFSRLGRQPLNKTRINMERLANNVFTELAALAPGRGLAFVAQTVPPAFGDNALIRQVLANLISNAIKFTRPRERAQIEFGYTTERESGAYYVRDNGVGFDMKYISKLFGVFQRVHSASDFEGTGVGLALVNRIISRHGGRTWAVGEPERGATFFFTLPAEPSS